MSYKMLILFIFLTHEQKKMKEFRKMSNLFFFYANVHQFHFRSSTVDLQRFESFANCDFNLIFSVYAKFE